MLISICTFLYRWRKSGLYKQFLPINLVRWFIIEALHKWFKNNALFVHGKSVFMDGWHFASIYYSVFSTKWFTSFYISFNIRLTFKSLKVSTLRQFRHLKRNFQALLLLCTSYWQLQVLYFFWLSICMHVTMSFGKWMRLYVKSSVCNSKEISTSYWIF